MNPNQLIAAVVRVVSLSFLVTPLAALVTTVLALVRSMVAPGSTFLLATAPTIIINILAFCVLWFGAKGIARVIVKGLGITA